MASPLPPDSPPRLMQQFRDRIRFRHYSLRTEEAYVAWIRRYILFHGKRHPARDGRAGSHGVPLRARDRAQRRRGHAEPGAVGAAVPLPGGAGDRAAVAR